MLKIIEKTLVMLLISLVATTPLSFPPVYAATIIYVDPPSIIDPTLDPGERFNITERVSNVVDMFAWQVTLKYNSTILNATRAWRPTWDPEYVFYGKSTVGLSPSFALGSILIGDSLYSPPLFSGSGKLAIIEFEVKGRGSTVLNITNLDTYLLDYDLNEISGVVKNNGYFENIVPFEFSVSATPSTRVAVAGESTTFTATATLVSGTTKTVSWSASGLPSGAAYTFTPPSGLPTFSSTLKITTSTTTPPGVYTITIKGTGPCVHGSHSTTVKLKVMNFTVAPTPFSPNGDGVKDKATIKATFWQSLSWKLVIKNSTGTVVRSLGSGTSLSLTKTWDGKNSLGAVVPDGTYYAWLSGSGFAKKKPVVVDNKPPTVTNVTVKPSSFNTTLGQKTTISYTLSEACYVTIKIYNSTGSLAKTLLNNVLKPAGSNSIVWNGKDNANNIVPAGKYTIKIWVTDKAGNKATPYPIIKYVTVTK